MQNLKYHLINIAAITVFAYVAAITVNEVVKFKIAPEATSKRKRVKKRTAQNVKEPFEKYKDVIIGSNFFGPEILTPEGGVAVASGAETSAIGDLQLLGTITGPWSISRAIIKKKREKKAKLFGLSKRKREPNNDVYGNKLVAVYATKVMLEVNGQRIPLELYDKTKKDSKKGSVGKGKKLSQNISKAEIQQKVLNNMDNAMRGLRAGPYRKNGKVEGYRLIRVKPYNILYKLGARSGDIVKRINGHKIDSTETLMKLWGNMKNEPKLSIDVERGGSPMSFDLNITE
ncbi:MAG: hypothetical protein GY754_44190 [bacterium]|nr:hypothetical protein [bacterium]